MGEATHTQQTAREIEQLRLLAIFHYVLGALLLVGGFAPIFHLAFGIGMLTGIGPFAEMQAEDPGFAVFMGVIFVGVSVTMMLCAWLLGVLALVAGRWLQGRQRHFGCMVVAGALCLVFPLGTALGGWTLVVLNREQVRGLFDADVRGA